MSTLINEVRKILRTHLDYTGNEQRFSPDDLAVLERFISTDEDVADKSIELRVWDERKQAIGVVFNRPGRVDIEPYDNGMAKGKLLVYVYDGVSFCEENEPIGCFDGAETGNGEWVK